MNKKRFSQPHSKGCPIQRQMVLGLKLVYNFINFVIPLPATYIRHSQRNCGRLPKRMVKQIQRFVRYFSKKIAEALLRQMMFLSFCLGNLIADNFIAEIRMLRCSVLYIII